jgi:O-antigen ligase/tetratricopeptide (TPR) repeat protein
MNDEPSSTPTRDAPRQVASRWLLAAVVVGSALAVGSLHTAVLCVVVAVLAVATFLGWYGAASFRARPAATLLLFTGLGLIAWTLLQVVPLPAGLLSTLAPANADVWARALTPLKEPGPAWATLSLDPYASRVQVLRGVAYLLAFLTALRVAQRREGSVFLERTIVLSAATVALAALLHPAFGATKVFGLYQPVNTYAFLPKHIGPLLNSNHLSGYMVIGACVALGIVVSPRALTSRAFAGAVVLVAIGTQLWAGSRGGTLAMVMGVVLVPATTWLASRGERHRMTGLLVPALLAACGVAVAVLASFDHAWADLSSTDVSKAQMWVQGFRLARESPLFGIGRGAYESVFPAVRSGTGYYVFTQAENVVVQWCAEWGIPVAVAAGAAILYALRPHSLTARTRLPAGAWVALACLFVHNLVDFTSEVPGVVIVLVVCAALVVGGEAAGPAKHAQRWASTPSRVALVAAVAAVVGIAFALPTNGHDLNSDQYALHDAAVDPSNTQFRDEARAAMLRHPGDPYLPFVGGVHAALLGDETGVIPWAGKALERSPVYGRAHLLLARALTRRSPAQARLEYRLALIDEPFLLGYVQTESPRLIQGYDDAMQVVPDGAAGIPLLEALSRALDARLPATRVRLDAELRARDPKALEPVRRALQDLLAAAEDGDAAPWCGTNGATCLEKGLQLAGILVAAAPRTCDAHWQRAQLLVAKGEGRRALDELEKAQPDLDDRGACGRRMLTLALQLKDEARATDLIDKMTREGCPPDLGCAENFVYLAQTEERRGNQRRAYALYKKACEVGEDRPELLAERARIAALLGLHVEALQVYTRLAQEQPGEPRWAKLAGDERAALSRGNVEK